MKSLVIYDSVFGNTARVAGAITQALGAEALSKKVDQVTPADLMGIGLLVVGSPTRGFKPTEGMTGFLNSLGDHALQGIKVLVFDTRIPLESISSKFFRTIVKMGGFADKPMAETLKKKGAMVVAMEGFFVVDREGPLVDGELERAAAWVAAYTRNP